jgi:hypothetical protein
MVKEQGYRDPFDLPQYKIMLIPDYSETMSCVVTKVHHSFTDGLGMSSFFLLLSGMYSADAIPALKPLALWKKVFIKLMIPILFVRSNI